MTRKKRIRWIIAVFAAVMLLPAAVFAAEAEEAPAVTEPAGSEEPSSEGLRIAVQGGTITVDGEICSGTVVRSDDGLTTLPAQLGTFTVTPQDGRTVQKVLVNGMSVPLSDPAEGKSFTFAIPAEGGSIAAVCARQLQTHVEICGTGDVALIEGDEKIPVYDGASYTLPTEESVTFAVAEQPDSSFAGAEFNGDAVDAEQTTEGWTFTIDAVPDGIVHVEFTPSVTVTAALENCTLLTRQNDAWTPVAGSVLQLKSMDTLDFALQADEDMELETLCVNGTQVYADRTDDKLYVFEVDDATEDVLITAVCSRPRDNICDVDEETGIIYTLPGRDEDPLSNITVGSHLVIEELTEGDRYERASTACSPYGEVVNAYDIVLEGEDSTYEPTTAVTVSFPLPEELEEVPDEELALIHIGEGGSLTKVPFERTRVGKRSYLVGSADHFSTFAVVRSAKPAVAAGVSQAMGDETNLTLYLILAIVAVAVVAVAAVMLVKHRRRRGK